MLVVWLLHDGLTRTKAAEIAGLSHPTVQRYVAAYREGGLDGADDTRGEAGVADDPQLPGVRRCLIAGRVN
jgi:transposase